MSVEILGCPGRTIDTEGAMSKAGLEKSLYDQAYDVFSGRSNERYEASKITMYVVSGMSVKMCEHQWTKQGQICLLPLLVDLGLRLRSFERETFVPHVWCRQQRCHHRLSQRSNCRRDPCSRVFLDM
jgi:hypothetical protein